MKICGIIAEYNPFHNGHLHQIRTANADITIAIMSGNFVQRGLPSCWDKRTRAKYALDNGIDLVLELPVDFAVASAERFAFGGVYILNALGIVDTICFGAENNLDELEKTAELIMDTDMKNVIETSPSDVPYHISRANAIGDNEILTKPNNILAVEYLKALKKLSSSIKPTVIERQGAGYNDISPKGGFASATFLRKALQEGGFEAFMPTPVPSSKIVTPDDFYPLLRYRILQGDLSDIAEIREGIENRIMKTAYTAESFDELVDSIKTKRYTRTSICRMLMQSLLNIRKQDLSEIPQYTRVLAATDKGCELLKIARKASSIPIVTKGADIPKCRESELDSFATDIYALATSSALRSDFTEMPHIKK